MASKGWVTMSFDEAVQVNPSVPLTRGIIYPFVDMQAIDLASRSVGPSERREFTGGGSRFIEDDTLMARITPCLENGKIARFAPDDDQKIGHGSTEFIVIRGKPKVTDNDFAYYLTKWDGVRLYCISQMTGSSGRQRVPTTALSHCEVTIPPLKEQQAIACILGALDDKIELNRRMNQTLEAIARAIFKSWFVDFDPAHGHGPHKEWQDSPLGRIPKGWEVVTVQDLGAVICGKTPPTHEKENYGNDVPFVTIPDMHGKVFVTVTQKSLSQKGAATQKNKFLPPFSICVSCIATPGLVALTSKICQTNQQINSVIPSDPNTSLFCYFVLRGLGDQIRSHGAGGSVLLNLNKSQFSTIKVITAPRQGLVTFQKIALPIFNRILTNENESRTLAAIRDALLPKLISGELRVPDAERIVGRTL